MGGWRLGRHMPKWGVLGTASAEFPHCEGNMVIGTQFRPALPTPHTHPACARTFNRACAPPVAPAFYRAATSHHVATFEACHGLAVPGVLEYSTQPTNQPANQLTNHC